MLAELNWGKNGVENGSDGYFWYHAKIGNGVLSTAIPALEPEKINEKNILSENFANGVPIVVFRSGSVGTCIVAVNETVVDIEHIRLSHTYKNHSNTTRTYEVDDSLKYKSIILTRPDRIMITGKLRENSDSKIKALIFFEPRTK